MALRIHNRRWYPFALLIGVAIVVVSSSFLQSDHRSEFLIAGIGGVAAFTYFLYQQHLDQTKFFKELFVEFNARYDLMNDGLNAVVFGPIEPPPSEKERDAERNLLFDYFNLCAEEYLFYKAGYIDEDVWEWWRKGMFVFFKHPRIRKLWEDESGNGSYYGFSPPDTAK